jgi:hypothetical protein
MERKGISYVVGREILGKDWRPDFNPQVVHRELEIIKNDLHSNTVRICGKDISRLTLTAQDALKQGFEEVWLSPDLWDHNEQETFEYIIAAAKEAEKLRQQWPDKVVLTIGSELTLFMKGILGGETFLERVGSPVKLMFTMLKLKYLGTHNKPLNRFLARANHGVREVFHGPVTYASAPIEKVDWSIFDFVCIDYYRGKQNKMDYGKRLQHYFSYGKPVVITEVGCCTYQGAEDKGGRAFMIVDRKHPDRLQPGYVRDEGLQAREDVDMLTELDKARVNGAFVFTFTMPTMKHSEDPLRDFDKASYSLVKSYADGRHSATYPDMAWEPKESFRAVADFYKDE